MHRVKNMPVPGSVWVLDEQILQPRCPPRRLPVCPLLIRTLTPTLIPPMAQTEQAFWQQERLKTGTSSVWWWVSALRANTTVSAAYWSLKIVIAQSKPKPHPKPF